MADDEFTVYVANFDVERVTEKLLHELFSQAGPVNRVFIRPEAKYAFVIFEDEESVNFACEIMDGCPLFNRPLKVRPKNGSENEKAYKVDTHNREARQGNNNRVEYSPAARSYSDSDRRRDDRRGSFDRGGGRDPRDHGGFYDRPSSGRWQEPPRRADDRQQQSRGGYVLPPPPAPPLGYGGAMQPPPPPGFPPNFRSHQHGSRHSGPPFGSPTGFGGGHGSGPPPPPWLQHDNRGGVDRRRSYEQRRH